MKRFQLFRKIVRHFMKRLQYYGQNSSVHGLKWVFDKGSNFFARIFWICILLASTGSLYFLLKPIIFEKNHVTFTPDSLYLDWTTTFPAVTICEAYNPKRAQRKLTESYPNLTEALNYDYRRYVTDLVYGRGFCSRSVCTPCGDKIPCDVPWSSIIRHVHLTCHELLSACNFNTHNFTCCKKFLPVDSEHGPCYSFNSLQTKNVKSKTSFVVNRKTGPGVLSFRLIADAQISIHSPEELSTNILDTKFKFDANIQEDDQVDILFSIKEVESDPQLKFEDMDVRMCRYLEEIPPAPLHNYPVYSYGACRLASNTEQSFKYCGCVHPARDVSYSDKYCNFTGLNCLVTYQANRTKFGIDKTTESDNCWPACEESDITIIHISRQASKYGRASSLVNIRMSSLPTMRYQMKLLRSNLDLVVSVGGIVGLFFGASILSMVEVFYLLFRSPK